MKDKTKNQINVLNIFKKDGVWMFNDSDVGLFEEPFVPSMNPLIESVVTGDKFRAFISHSLLPEPTLILDKCDDYMESSYKLRGTELIGWLCPATLKYFEDYPNSIYIIVEQ